MPNDIDIERQRYETTYAIYRRLHTARAAYAKATLRTVLSELMYAEPLAWRAVGITRAALDVYNHAGKSRVQGIERAHLTDRLRMVQYIIERDVPLSHDELFSYWRDTDKAVIALRSENRCNNLGDWIAFDNADARYFPRLAIGFDFRHGVEGELIRQLIASLAE